ncbi:MAG: hypothetical protein JW785_09690, partial [Acidimicrobiia bacterium]|nr:hypothetical protein [Acidimicrobiia bacterium]
TAAAPTSTTAPTTSTTRAPDAHPVWPRTWAEVWPADGAEATYQVLTYDDETFVVAARIDYAVSWEGGT